MRAWMVCVAMFLFAHAIKPALAGGLSFSTPLVAPMEPEESPAREWIEHAAAIEAARQAAKHILRASPALQALLDALGRSVEDPQKVAPGVRVRPVEAPRFGEGGVVEQTMRLEQKGRAVGLAQVRLHFLDTPGPLSARMARWELAAAQRTGAVWEKESGIVQVGDLAAIRVETRDAGLARLFAAEFAKVQREHP